MHPAQKIYLDLEPHFIYDYIFFSAHLRFLQSQESSHKNYNLKQMAKAMCLVNLFEIYQKSLEDLAAVTLALYRRYGIDANCRYQKKFNALETPLSFTLINYREANLKDVLALLSTDEDIINKLGIKNFQKININLLYPDINFSNVYRFFVVGLKSLATDQDKRLKMFNKIKHGGIVVGDGHLLSDSLSANTPAVIYDEAKSFSDDDHSLIIHGFKYTEEEFEMMEAGIMKIMVMIKVLFSIYLCKEYPNTIKKNGHTSTLDLLAKIEMKKYLSLWNGY